jgi:hydroxymethylpyrimidine/phosphomethylpyrimidine kinase
MSHEPGPASPVRLPAALTIAGSDSSGGAGIQADLKTFTALGTYGASVLTALTAQNTRGVTAVHVPPADFVRAQIDAVFDDLDVRAVKTGMLANRSIVLAVAEAMERRADVPLVVDPVMVATSGDPLIDDDAVEAVRERLLPRALIITPNLPEAARLLGARLAGSPEDVEAQARALVALGCRYVLVKGGHRQSERAPVEAIDVLASPDGSVETVSAPWIDTPNTHGTGCTLSAAIAARLVSGAELPAAVRQAKTFLTRALESGRQWQVGQGHGPVDHLYAIRSREIPN